MILRATTYCKKASCPSSKSLLGYRGFELGEDQMVWVESHLEDCDFCGAEIQLLTEHVPLENEICSPVEMPSNLRCLAQSLLAADWLHIEAIAETALEKERFTLTDA